MIVNIIRSFRAFQARECQTHLENAIQTKLPVEILLGKKNIEVRPTATNKGEIVKRLCDKYAKFDFIFCAGDDKTDEDMFEALLEYKNCKFKVEVNTCLIAPRERRTCALYRMPDCDSLLCLLAEMCKESDL